MASVPVGGALAEKHGYLALSIYTGVSLILGAVFLIAARLVQARKLSAIV